MWLFKVLAGISLVFICGFLFGCIDKEDIDRFVEEQFAERSSASSNEPAVRDFDVIRESGVLRMITSYSANNYFLHHGREAGFEYEFLNAFARENDLEIEVIFTGSEEDPQNLLMTGAGDVIAANYTVTPARKEVVQFTRPYHLADKILVYSDSLENQPATLDSLSGSGLPIMVRQNSSGHAHLHELIYRGFDLEIEFLPGDMDTKTLLIQVADGSVPATILDEHTIQAASGYISGLEKGPVIARNDTIAWAIRKNAPELESQLNRYLERHFKFSESGEQIWRSAALNMLRFRYHNASSQIEDYYNPERIYSGIGLITSYEELIKSTADSLDLDWLLLSAIIVQESGFNPNAKSVAGAVGLMQVLPRFSSTEYQHLYDPVINIREGAKILKGHLDHYAYLDSLNRLSFALASYNTGVGHIIDARRMVMDQNKNPNEWENVEDALLKKMQRRYYEQARFGYSRGIETVQYVKEIRNRYQMYQRVAMLESVNVSDRSNQDSGL